MLFGASNLAYSRDVKIDEWEVSAGIHISVSWKALEYVLINVLVIITQGDTSTDVNI